MKFAKELEEQAVPEWKTAYLDYKKGKKKVKAVGRALRELEAKSPGNNFTSPFSSLRDAPVRSRLRQSPLIPHASGRNTHNAQFALTRSRSEAGSRHVNGATEERSRDEPERTRAVNINERSPLRSNETRPTPRMARYGSIIGSPPLEAESERDLRQASTLELPMPSIDPANDTAVDPLDETTPTPQSQGQDRPRTAAGLLQERQDTQPGDGKTWRGLRSRYSGLRRSLHRSASTPDTTLISRVFSFSGRGSPHKGQNQSQAIPLAEYRELDFRREDFLTYLDTELSKIGAFYREKEDEAIARLTLLRDQLHTMRYWRVRDIQRDEAANHHSVAHRHLSAVTNGGYDKIGKTSHALARLGSPSIAPAHTDIEGGNVASQDYQRREAPPIKYSAAKKKLKAAMQELYRSLELLKSYSTLNQKAFRKITKKYNKTAERFGGPPTDYMREKVNSAEFITSDKVDELMRDVEDLYARYFERGNHKAAVNKLRAKMTKSSDYGGPMFRNGALLFTGLIFGLQGIVYGAMEYYDPSTAPEFQTTTSYLLQIYGGYTCFLALAFCFVLDAMFFEAYRVNYPFIFELDNRSSVNWRQLAELPSAFACILGVCMWLNFTQVGGMIMYIYWPVILIGVSTLLLFAPVPGFFYWRSREWLAQSLFRLAAGSGIFAVEFRDFFLGDMFCSQTYAMGNIELYFCLYANSSDNRWINPGQCNSTSSRLLGFLSTLPGIWRALQCLRRFRDTHNWYPHLANFGKYLCTIGQYMFLSLWRLSEESISLKAGFITMASINSVYCIYWDIVNDWSLSPISLRSTLAYRKIKWIYYAAMIEDMVFRFLWIGYVIFHKDFQVQHSSVISFMIAILEVFRRGIWVIFRVENEHCTNVARYRAVKNPELPYPAEPETQIDGQAAMGPDQDSPLGRALKRVGTTVLAAHSQDYERRRPDTVQEEDGASDDDDEGEEGDEDSD